MSESTSPLPTGALDLVNEIRRVLRESDEPLTAGKIRDRLPAALGPIHPATLADLLRRQAAASVVVSCPKYRSSQDRYWDRPLLEHVHEMVRDMLRADGPLPWSELRRRLPRYARYLAESVLNEQLAHGRLFRHPPTTPRAAPRYALGPADPRDLRPVLDGLFTRLEQLGFSPAQVRDAARQLVVEEAWAGHGAKPISSYVYTPDGPPAPGALLTSDR